MFSGRPRVRVIADILQGNIEPPKRVASDIPDAVSDACMRALRLEPERRFQTAREFVTRLRAAALLAQVDVADSDAIRGFVQQSGVEAYRSRQNLRLQDEEQTLLEPPPDVGAASPATSRAPSRRVLYAAAALVTGALALIPVLASSSGKSVQVAPTLPDPIELPELIIEPSPVIDLAELARTARDAQSSLDGDGVSKKVKTAEKEMYHPKGL
jgi:hypothetical protein